MESLLACFSSTSGLVGLRYIGVILGFAFALDVYYYKSMRLEIHHIDSIYIELPDYIRKVL